ncbi:MAG: right-handed parallel beta-helix repeat-containing protein [Planctomycetota bacterium]
MPPSPQACRVPWAGLAWAIAFSFAAPGALGADLYVDNVAGSDELNGARRSTARGAGPVRTINRALCLARPGDRIVIAKTSEPYREQLTIGGRRLRGNSLRPLTITSDGAVLDGTVRAATGAWRHLRGDVFAMRPRRLAYQQLLLDGAPLQRVGLISLDGAAAALRPREWALVGGNLLMRTDAARLPSDYDLRHAGLQTGVTLYNARDVVIEGLVIQGFQLDGVNAHGLVKNCVLRGLECRANGRSGISAGGVSRLRAAACNVYDNGAVQVRTEALARLDLDGCDVERDAGTPAWSDGSGGLRIDGEPAGDEDVTRSRGAKRLSAAASLPRSQAAGR